MANGIASLRRYQIGGGIGDPEDNWLERLIRDLKRRWSVLDPDWNIGEFGEELFDKPVRGVDYHTFVNESGGEAIDDLIGLSNFDLDFDEGGLSITPAPFPHAVPPLSDTPARWEESRGMGIDPDDLIEGPSDILDQPVHDLDEVFRKRGAFPAGSSVDDAIEYLIHMSNVEKEWSGLPGEAGSYSKGPLAVPPPLSAALQREADIASLAESDIWNVDDRYKSKLPAYSSFDSPHRSGIGSLLNRLTSGLPKWGSIAAPLLAAAASPAALAAETAFDFAISPESLGGTASEVPGAGRTWRESLHIDPSDEEVASFMQTLLGDSPYSQSQLARPSTTSQRAIEQLIRRAQAGTPVNRYRR